MKSLRSIFSSQKTAPALNENERAIDALLAQANSSPLILDLSNREISLYSENKIAEFISTHSVNEINLSNCKINNLSVIKAIASSQSMKKIDFSDTPLHPPQVLYLLNSLGKNNSLSALELNLSNSFNFIARLLMTSDTMPKSLNECLDNATAKNKKIRVIWEELYKIFYCLAELLRTNKLTSLNVSKNITSTNGRNPATQQCLLLLAEGLIECTSLKELNLSSNFVDHLAIAPIIDNLKTNPNSGIKKLILRDNELDNLGPMKISELLELPTCKIELVDLSNNKAIIDFGIRNITDALQKNKNSCLQTLQIRHDELVEDAEFGKLIISYLQALVSKAQNNKTLITMECDYTCTELTEFLNRNRRENDLLNTPANDCEPRNEERTPRP